jgi:hypothetical protein
MADDRTNTPTVKFNVGGKAYETSRRLILQHKDTMLARLVLDGQADLTKPIFIDRNGTTFGFVLDYLRYGHITLPMTVSKEMFLLDMDFYGIVRDESKVKASADETFSPSRARSLSLDGSPTRHEGPLTPRGITMNPPTTDHAYYHADDDFDGANLDRHWTTNESDEEVYDGNDYADLIVSILKRRWQGEAGDEDDDIIADIIEQQRNLMRRADDRDDMLGTSIITEEIDPDRDDVLGTRTITEETFRVIVPGTVAPGEIFMVFIPDEPFMVYAGGRSMCVRCPENTMPGEVVQVKVPVLNSIKAIEPMPRSPRSSPPAR